jgi:non-specific serine/threonine protein kinase
LDNLWYGCGEMREGRLWLERVLAADPHPSRERVRALAAYASIALLQGQPATAVDLAGHYLELARRFDEPVYMAQAMTIIGFRHVFRNQPEHAVALFQRAAALAGDLDPVHPQVAYAKVACAHALLLQGDTRRAGELLADGQQICRAHGDLWYLGLVLYSSAEVALALPDPAQALSHARESLRLRQAFHDTPGAARGLELLAWVAMADRSPVRAARLLGAADQQWQTIGGSTLSPYQAGRQARTAVRETLGDATFDAEHRRGADLTLDDAVAYALGLQQIPAEQAISRPADQPRLTRREREIAELVAQGLTNRQIAAHLVISPRTAESHIEHILVKLGFTARTQIATGAVEALPNTTDSPSG